MNFEDKRITAGCIALCQTGRWETGQGTCAAICMEQLGPVRPRPCRHATKIFGTIVKSVLKAVDEVKV